MYGGDLHILHRQRGRGTESKCVLLVWLAEGWWGWVGGQVPEMEAGERCGFESVSCQMNLGLG